MKHINSGLTALKNPCNVYWFTLFHRKGNDLQYEKGKLLTTRKIKEYNVINNYFKFSPPSLLEYPIVTQSSLFSRSKQPMKAEFYSLSFAFLRS